jgi:acyl-coenzyme A thioesterase PaaI-like protein
MYAAESICFGCGPANQKGLKIRSFAAGERVVATWQPEKYHEAFPGVLNGGIIGSLLDCHSNWTAAWYLMKVRGLDKPPVTVTAEYSVKLLRPTPSDKPLKLTAKVVKSNGDKVTVEAKIEAGQKICNTCRGVFVAVNAGHPAYNRW